MKAVLPYQLDQLRAHCDWLDRALADGRKFLLGEQPGTADLAAYHCVWFVQRNVGTTAAPLGGFARLLERAGDRDQALRSSGRRRARAFPPRGLRRIHRVSILPSRLLPVSLVGSYPQPDWLIDRQKLAKQTPPRVRAQELWRVAPAFLEQAQDD